MGNSEKIIEKVRQIGLRQLELIDSQSADVEKWKTSLMQYQFNDQYLDDGYAWLTSVLALVAIDADNFGVGAILVDGDGCVVYHAHNEVFNPYFRSDRHAEMVVMDKFENTHRDLTKLDGYAIYTSLESCPMCLSRLITSGIKKVLYVAPDVTGGMVHKMRDLPPVWTQLAKRQTFAQAKCSDELISAASQIFLLNVDELNRKLKNR